VNSHLIHGFTVVRLTHAQRKITLRNLYARADMEVKYINKTETIESFTAEF